MSGTVKIWGNQMAHGNETGIRTSISHPLLIAEVKTAGSGGRIGITFCPGKKQNSALTGAWDRDLDKDLDRIQDWGASALVTLTEQHEMDELCVGGMGDAVRRRHIAWHHLPIQDVSIPGASFHAAWEEVGEQLRAQLRRGFDIVIHCKGGLGRAGMIAAKLLVELGYEPEQAISLVRAVRPGAIETDEQYRYVQAQEPAQIHAPPSSQETVIDRALGALVGLAVGDAVGTTLEFAPRDTYTPIFDMVGGGPFHLRPGEWTDDTAMALALADSLIACKKLDETDLMQRFSRWRDEGAYSCTGTCFDIGITTSRALDRWNRTGDPIAGSIDPHTAGNGSLMRLAPVALMYWNDRSALRDAAARQSSTTHAAPAAVAACEVYADLLADAIAGHSLDDLLSRAKRAVGAIADPDIAKIVAGSWRGKRREDIRGSGYVVDAMEAAIWCVARSGSYREAVLTAANLGEDADTTAAIAGQLAGAIYGLSGIPEEWRERLAWEDRILDMGRQLITSGNPRLASGCE
jgi:ADP-ribosyl-[dinitrogen reductase] hydrolase